MGEEKPDLHIRPRKRLGRIRRGAKLGVIKPVRGEGVAGEVEGEAGEQ